MEDTGARDASVQGIFLTSNLFPHRRQIAKDQHFPEDVLDHISSVTTVANYSNGYLSNNVLPAERATTSGLLRLFLRTQRKIIGTFSAAWSQHSSVTSTAGDSGKKEDKRNARFYKRILRSLLGRDQIRTRVDRRTISTMAKGSGPSFFNRLRKSRRAFDGMRKV